MVSSEGWIPEGIAVDRPNAARIYDCLLGGYHNFAIDRQVTEKMVAVYPDLELSAQENRKFLRRTVEFVVGQGIDQILDLGSGIPTLGNVHEAAQAINPDVRVVYVDIDPVAVAHSNAMLVDNPLATAIQMDVRQAEAILNHEEVNRLLDLSRPLAILFITVLHYVVDDREAFDTLDTYVAAAAKGSYVVISHASTEWTPPERTRLQELFGSATATKPRPRDAILQFFDGLELLEPGLVWTPQWRSEGPDDELLSQPERAFTQGGVARKG